MHLKTWANLKPADWPDTNTYKLKKNVFTVISTVHSVGLFKKAIQNKILY